MNIVSTIITAAIASFLSSLATGIIAARKNKAQIAKIRAEAFGQELENYRGILSDMRKQVEYWKSEATETQKRFHDSMTLVYGLENEVRKLKKDLHEANTKIEKLEKHNNEKA
ncbi:hypothetical protein SDC9_46853 [bioreactor metagenome]|uniref:Uncharacterized protein n=1 Tax=bioreactor metagenome TaxID=1076179 RepID=A0A644WA08_9ZZZZ